MGTKLRLVSNGETTLEVNIGEGWVTAMLLPGGRRIEFYMTDVRVIPEPEQKPALPAESETPAVVPRRNVRILIMKAIRAFVLLPLIILPLLYLVIFGLALWAIYPAGAVPKVRVLKTIAYDLFDSVLKVCVAIEDAVVQD